MSQALRRLCGVLLALALLAVGLALTLRVAHLGAPQGFLGRPLHADEAGQWSLLCEGRPHSETADRFHGPALGLIARARCVLGGIEPATLSERGLRLIPWVLGLTLLLPALRRGEPGRLVLVAFAILPMGRFIQEPILATVLVWAALSWLWADESVPERAWRWRAAAGAFAGLALACKVTAALYLAVAALSYAWVGRQASARRGLPAFGISLLASWVLWQSSWLADLPALGTWWSQWIRAFGTATGASSAPLHLVDPWPWVVSGACLLGAAALRWRRVHQAWGAHPLDPLLLTAGAVYLIHLALPYQTPWLMLSVDTLVLVVLLPGLLPLGCISPESKHDPRLWLLVLAAMAGARWGVQSRYAYVETLEEAPALARAIRALPGASGLTIQVKGANYWPLPYYLRGLRVGYGDFAGAEQADIRWLEAAGDTAPASPGYRVFPVELRAGEVWWLLVREPLAGSLPVRR